jgi:arginyl-tRNA--protein-N-Asp/Glu arginylyltransferase
MAYKSRFRPSETLAGGVWRVLPDDPDTTPAEGLAQIPVTTA